MKKADGLYRRARKDGSPGAWVLDTVIHGKRYIRTFDRAFNLTLAREKADDARRKILTGEDEPPKPRPTLKEYATKWLKDVVGELEGKTLSRYRQDLEGHVLPALGALRLDQIDTAAVKAFLRGKQAHERPGKDEDAPPRRYAPDTLRLIRAALSVVLSEAVEDRLIEANPCLYRGGRRSKGRYGFQGRPTGDPADELNRARAFPRGRAIPSSAPLPQRRSAKSGPAATRGPV